MRALPSRPASGRRASSAARRTFARLGPLALSLASFVGGCHCHPDDTKKDNPNQAATVEGRATSRELLTKVGTARAVQAKNKEVHVPSTSVKWNYVAPLDDESAVLGGTLPGTGVSLRTEDGGRSWTSLEALVDGSSLITYGVAADKTLVISVAKRQIPKKKLEKDQLPPIDTLTLYFQTPGDKLSAPSPILAPSDKGPVIPKGLGYQAVLSKSASSFAVQMGPKVYGIAYGVPPTEQLPGITPVPANETPVFASYGRPPVLLTVTAKELLARPWPAPGEALAKPTPIGNVKLTKTLADELSDGPECEYRAWSYKRFAQPGGKTFVLGVSKDKQVAFELPPTVDDTMPMGCSADRITIEAKDPTKNGEPALVSCTLDGACVVPENHAFLRPWAEQHERRIAVAPWTKGVVAIEHMSNPSHWAMMLSESADGGKLYDIERSVGEGKGERGRFDIGALVGLGDRTLFLLSADITGTSARSWYVMASDDGGQTWTPP
jgi:hypothetical protein